VIVAINITSSCFRDIGL